MSYPQTSIDPSACIEGILFLSFKTTTAAAVFDLITTMAFGKPEQNKSHFFHFKFYTPKNS